MANSAQNDNAKCEVENQYKIEKCHSTVTPITDWQNEVKHFTNAKAVVWYYDAIEFLTINGKWEGRGEEEIVRLRIFDEKKELHVWRTNRELRARLRIDTPSEEGETEFVCAKQILNGTKFYWDETKGILYVSEGKGTNCKLPFKELKDMHDSKKRIALVTRNYIGYSEDIGQAGYVDCRFVGFENV